MLRWLVAGVVTLMVFAVCTWLAGAVVLPHLLRDHGDRWVIAAGCGVALAALAGLGAYRYATARAAGTSGERGTAEPEPVVSGAGERSISVGGDLDGIASTGDNSVNVQRQAARE